MKSHHLHIEYVAPGSLRPNPDNPRRHTHKQRRQIVNSIRRFGFANPILVGDDNTVIAGHGRLEAAAEAGLASVPIIRLSDLSAAEQRALMIADNRIAENSEWSPDRLVSAIKGIVVVPSAAPELKPESRDALLTAIIKARGWIDDIRLGRMASFAEIAKREAQGERHIRQLASLAFVSPRIIAAIVDGTAPADLTVTDLAKALPYLWTEQEQRIGLLQ